VKAKQHKCLLQNKHNTKTLTIENKETENKNSTAAVENSNTSQTLGLKNPKS
jgi:hypothetical protein